MDTIIYLLITMAFSAFFSGMEIAFVSVDKLRFEMERKPGVTSSILSCFFRNPNNFISTMLVGNNIALVIYGILMAQIIEVNLLVLQSHSREHSPLDMRPDTHLLQGRGAGVGIKHCRL